MTLPSEIDQHVGLFDRFADRVSLFTSKSWFFAACVLVVLLWAPSYFLLQSVDTWQLIINTLTTIVTFLMVALLQNTQMRATDALQHKLNAIADALSDQMRDGHGQDAAELRSAVGVENRESST